jgi:hypothetical protein
MYLERLLTTYIGFVRFRRKWHRHKTDLKMTTVSSDSTLLLGGRKVANASCMCEIRWQGKSDPTSSICSKRVFHPMQLMYVTIDASKESSSYFLQHTSITNATSSAWPESTLRRTRWIQQSDQEHSILSSIRHLPSDHESPMTAKRETPVHQDRHTQHILSRSDICLLKSWKSSTSRLPKRAK